MWTSDKTTDDLFRHHLKRESTPRKQLLYTTNNAYIIIVQHVIMLVDTMARILFWLTDEDASHWRHIATMIGVPKRDISLLETKYPLQTREKCLQSLYK